MKNRGHLPQTDAEMEEDIRDQMPIDQADNIIVHYGRLRATGMSVEKAALRAVTDDLQAHRRILARLLNNN